MGVTTAGRVCSIPGLFFCVLSCARIRARGRDGLLRYLVDRAIHNWDGFLAFYFGGNHNYYWYHTGAGRFELIPWDLDKTFWEYDRYFDPDPLEQIATPVPGWNVVPDRCGSEYWDAYVIRERIGPPEEGPASLYFTAPGCDKIVHLLASQHFGDFVTLGNAFLAELFTLEYLEGKLAVWEAQLDAAMQIEPTLTYTEWKDALATMRSHLPKLRADLTEHLADSYRTE